MQKLGQEQFDALVRPHLQTLYRVAYRLVRNVQDAQDLVQDTCVAACTGREALAAAESPLRWLLRTQHNRFIDAHRLRSRLPITISPESGDIEELASDLPDPEQLIEQFQSEQLLEQAYLQLEEVPRTLLCLRAEGYELPEIATITGIELTLLSSRLYRARLRLAQLVAGLHREAGSIHQIGSAK